MCSFIHTQPRRYTGMGDQNHAPAALFPRERPDTHCAGLLWPRACSVMVRNVSPSPGFEPRTVQPVTSLYTD